MTTSIPNKLWEPEMCELSETFGLHKFSPTYASCPDEAKKILPYLAVGCMIYTIIGGITNG